MTFMPNPSEPNQRAEAIRKFIRSRDSRPEYVAKRFKYVFELSERHGFAGEGRPSNLGDPDPVITSNPFPGATLHLQKPRWS